MRPGKTSTQQTEDTVWEMVGGGALNCSVHVATTWATATKYEAREGGRDTAMMDLQLRNLMPRALGSHGKSGAEEEDQIGVFREFGGWLVFGRHWRERIVVTFQGKRMRPGFRLYE